VKGRSFYAETVNTLTLAAVTVVVGFHRDRLGALTSHNLFYNLFFCKDLDFFLLLSLGADRVRFNKLVNIRGHFWFFIRVYIIISMYVLWRKACRFLRFIIIFAILLVNVFWVDINACFAYFLLLNFFTIIHVGLNLFCRPIGHHRSLTLRRL